MAMTERLSNLGYLAVGTETTKGTAVTPAFFVPVYDESLTTNANLQTQAPIVGGKFGTYDVLRGQRDHKGDITVLAEPNTAAHVYDMLLSRLSNSGSGPYTQVFGFSGTTAPKSKTIDISKGGAVHRFYGVEAAKVAEVWDNNEKHYKLTVSALGSFMARTIATISTITLTLDTKYDAAPNTGLVVGDLVQIYKASTGATLNTTIATVNADGITVTLAASAASFATGDVITLRPATPSLNLLPTFLWSRTQFKFSDTVTNALAATQYRVEKGSTFEIRHDFNDAGGEKRSGGYDPAALVRLTGDASLTVKQFFDTPEKVQQYNDLTKSAVTIQKYSGATNQYEERVSFYSVTTDTPAANLKANSINYATISFLPNYSQSDSADVRVTIIHGLSSI